MTAQPHGSSGEEFVWRRRRFLPPPPEQTVFDIPAPPVRAPRAPFQPATLIVPLLTGGSFLVYGLIAGQLPVVVLGLVATLGAVATPLVMRASSGWTAKRHDALRAAGYARLIGPVEAAARSANEAVRRALTQVHPPVGKPLAPLENAEPLEAWVSRGRRWERRLAHPDFLSVQLGYADIPTGFTVNVAQGGSPDAGVAQGADATEAERLARVVKNGPLCVSLREHAVLSIEGHREQALPLAQAMLAQLLLACGPDELSLLVAAPGSLIGEWQWAAGMPHALVVPPEPDDEGAGQRQARPGRPGLAGDSRELARALSHAMNARAQRLADGEQRAVPAIGHLVVVLDGFTTDPRFADRYPVLVLEQMLTQAADLSVSFIAVCLDGSGTPAPAPAVVAPARGPAQAPEREPGPRRAMVLRRTGQADKPFTPLSPVEHLTRRLDGQLGGRVLVTEAFGEDAGGGLLLDLVGRRGALAGAPSWEDRPADRLLTAKIGVRADGRAFTLNIREPALRGGSGPHGLVVGATGSGKSELLRTLVTSLALTHSPDTLQFALVDFKGGAAFAQLHERLPHSVALITNTDDDPSLVERLRAALAGVLDDRQRVLREASARAGRELPDIVRYRRVRGSLPGPELDPMPYLLVVIDEFAELTESNPDFLDLLARIGRKGRSVGVHLLLSSQAADSGQLRKLDEHLSYRIALRTFTAEQSVAAIHSRVAAKLPQLPGHGYFWTANSPLVRFKASQVSATTATVPGTGNGAMPDANDQAARSDLDTILDWLSGAEKAPSIWQPPLISTAGGEYLAMDGEEMSNEPLPERTVMPVAVGLVDIPEQRRRELAVFDAGRDGGHVAVFGAPQSGKSTTLVTAVLQAALAYDPGELRFFVLDCGGEVLRAVSDLPNVAAYATPQEPDRVARVMAEVLALLSEAPGAGEQGQRTVLLIDGYDAFKDRYPEHADAVSSVLVEGHGRQVHVHLTTSRPGDLTLAMQDQIGTRFELRLNESAVSPHDRARAAIQSAGPGRGLSGGRQVQFAAPAWGGYGPGQLTEVVAAVDAEARARWGGRRAERLRMLDALTLGEFLRAAKGTPPGQLLLGVGESSRSERAVRFRPGLDGSLLLYGDPGAGRTTALARLLAGGPGSLLGHAEVFLVDLRGNLLSMLGVEPGTPGTAISLSEVGEIAKNIAETLQKRMEARHLAGGAASGERPLALVVDDYELLYAMRSQGGRVLGDIAPYLQLGRQLGFSAVISQVAAGSAVREGGDTFLGSAAQSGAGRLYLSAASSRTVLLAGDYRGRRQPRGVAEFVPLGQPPARIRLLPPA